MAPAWAFTQAWYACQEVELRIARHLRPGTTLIDASTICPQAVEEVAALPPGGVALIDAPVVPRRAEAVTFGGKGRTEASAMERGNSLRSPRPTADTHQPSGLVGVHGHEKPGQGQWAQLGSVW